LFLGWVLCCDALLIQGNCEGLELVKIVQASSNQVTFDFVFEAIVECGGYNVGISEFGLQDDFFE
jgi:hypothetical protein